MSAASSRPNLSGRLQVLRALRVWPFGRLRADLCRASSPKRKQKEQSGSSFDTMEQSSPAPHCDLP